MVHQAQERTGPRCVPSQRMTPCRSGEFSFQPLQPRSSVFFCLEISASDKPFPEDEAARNVLGGCEEQLKAVDGAETFELGSVPN